MEIIQPSLCSCTGRERTRNGIPPLFVRTFLARTDGRGFHPLGAPSSDERESVDDLLADLIAQGIPDTFHCNILSERGADQEASAT